jgi:hypothetical protein
MKNVLISIALFLLFLNGIAQSSPDNLLSVRGFCIAAPKASHLDGFIEFIHNDLAPRNVNTLIIRVDYGYQYKSHPELADENALSASDIKKLVKACKQENIRIIPQVNLLGHQSWAGRVSNLLKVYPQFDETPHVKMPDVYIWPNEDGLYCKSYCPLHPEVHKIVFELVDEICEAFDADAFHAGMDEVFYIGEDSCLRCQGRDKAELFAGEVTLIYNHLAAKGRELWIWGDRLIDGKTTGIGMWEASMNNTHRAVDMIPKSVFICDWHYERPDPTAVYFAMKGFRVATCPWRNPEVAVKQADDMFRFRSQSAGAMSDKFTGIIQTVWSSAEQFLKEYHYPGEDKNTPAECFKVVFDRMANQGL